MRVVHEVLSPGVEDADKADLSQAPAQFKEGLFHSFKENIIDYLLVSQGKGIEHIGDGKDHMEVSYGEQIFLPRLNPFFLS